MDLQHYQAQLTPAQLQQQSVEKRQKMAQRKAIRKKRVYKQLAEDDKVRYKNEIKSWEEHMVDIGREDLIREQTLSKKKKTAVKRPPAVKSTKKAKTTAAKPVARGNLKTTKTTTKKTTKKSA
ncbi:unnamed protein product [Tetraodon nigroviridis]|uniref:(spotted green pufferfish) hypothetical protein n=1 Tax=Tetraodon nigroviridis TaxID=99883 RepID=Q4T731_TETNG|nr:unnamed protein product [Tetraodon nigroviridis]